ncbi:MAG: hypothetical protein BACD_02609 [Bacteroides rodentium]
MQAYDEEIFMVFVHLLSIGDGLTLVWKTILVE